MIHDILFLRNVRQIKRYFRKLIKKKLNREGSKHYMNGHRNQNSLQGPLDQ